MNAQPSMASSEPATERRSEERRRDLVDRATLLFRGDSHRVPVLDISTRGAMIEADFEPRVGESVIVRFECCSPIHAFVRWVRDGRIGINFGHELTVG